MPAHGRVILIILAIFTLACPAAQAAPLVSESFDYLPGSNLIGATGGFGFTNAWSSTGAPQLTTGLTHPLIADSSGLAFTTASNATTSIKRTVNTALFPVALTNNGATFGTATASGTLWVSYLQKITHTWSYCDFGGLRVGTASASSPYITVTSQTGAGNYTYTAGQTNLIIMKFVFNSSATTSGQDQFTLWVNPTSATLIGDAPTANFPFSFTAFNQIQFANIAGGTAGNGGSAVFDELRMGTDLAQVIPEPASLALLALPGLTLLRRRQEHGENRAA